MVAGTRRVRTTAIDRRSRPVSADRSAARWCRVGCSSDGAAVDHHGGRVTDPGIDAVRVLVAVGVGRARCRVGVGTAPGPARAPPSGRRASRLVLRGRGRCRHVVGDHDPDRPAIGAPWGAGCLAPTCDLGSIATGAGRRHDEFTWWSANRWLSNAIGTHGPRTFGRGGRARCARTATNHDTHERQRDPGERTHRLRPKPSCPAAPEIRSERSHRHCCRGHDRQRCRARSDGPS